MAKKLAARQQRFVQEYLVDLNATQAAIRAGYSVKTARSAGQRLLTFDAVHAAIQARQQALQAKVEVRQEEVVRELIRVGFSDMRKIAQWNAHGLVLHDSADLEDDAALAIQEVSCVKKTRTFGSEEGEPVTIEEVNTRAKLYSKLEALTKLGQHLGLFVERREVSGPGGKPIAVQTLPQTPEARDAEIAHLLTKRAQRNGHAAHCE